MSSKYYIDHSGIFLLILEHPDYLISLYLVAAESMTTKRTSVVEERGAKKKKKTMKGSPFIIFTLYHSILVSCFSQYSQIFPHGQMRREGVTYDSNNVLFYKLP